MNSRDSRSTEALPDMLVTFATAQAAVDAGYDVDTYRHYWADSPNAPSTVWEARTKAVNKEGRAHIPCPTQALLARWLRDKHGLHVHVQFNMHYCWQVQVQDIRGYDGTTREVDTKWLMYDYGTYEEATEAGLAHALEQSKAPVTRVEPKENTQPW